MKWLRGKLKISKAELLILVVFFLINLRVLNWYQPGFLVFSGDLRPPIVPNVFLQNALNSWNEVDWGVPSVYSPRILDPFTFFMIAFQIIGVNTFISELMATYLIYVLVAILMYVYIKRITKGDKIAAFIGALFFISNISLIVDREQTAIGFVSMSLMILPSVVAFTESLKRRSVGFMALSGALFILTYAAFPNYRAPVLCLITFLITIFSLYIMREPKSSNENESRAYGISMNLGPKFFKVSFNLGLKFFKVPFNLGMVRKYIKYILAFIVAALLASIWIIVLVSANLNSLISTLEQATSPSIAFGNRAPDVLRLIAQWSIYSQYAGNAYVPYGKVYLENSLMIILSYIPTILAFAAMLVSKSRKLAIFFGSLTIIFLLLTSGSSESFSKVYSLLIEGIPLMRAFRTSTNWIFLVVLGFSMLIGLFVSGLCHRTRRNVLKLIVIALTAGLFLFTTYPLITGETTVNWLDVDSKGAYIPPYFSQVENAMSNRYWTILLPLRSVYPIYNFSEGGVLAAGNPYPMVFSKPFLSGIGTEYIASTSSSLQNKVFGAILRGPDVMMVTNIGNASASSFEIGREPALAVDINYATRWASNTNLPQWYEIDWSFIHKLSSVKIVFENAYADDYNILTWDGSGWITQIEVSNNTQLKPEHSFSKAIFTTRLRIEFTKASTFNQVSMYELETNPQEYAQTYPIPKFMGMLGIKNLLVEKNMIAGNYSSVEDIYVLSQDVVSLVHEWDGASLYENKYVQEKIYFADSIQPYSGLFEMFQAINSTAWSELQHTAFVESAEKGNWTFNGTLGIPANASWEQISQTNYRIKAKSDFPFLLAFLENYDAHWKVFVNGKPVSENNHVKVNSFANGWIITEKGNLAITIEYDTQSTMAIAVLASIILTMLFTAVIFRKRIKVFAYSLVRKIR